jgi:MFS family permease
MVSSICRDFTVHRILILAGLQTVTNWQEYFGHPTGSLLGVFNAIQSIGGIAGLPFAPWANDKFGRRWALFFGNVRKL